ncbi:MAG: ABC transporter ATP-binding protein/permease, partial [Lachnospiraceae bacterium]|nr:ABC transporter ATP-binding protein/permease [Lachnospiraceae bacterium]
IDIIKCVCLILFSAVSILSIHWLLALEIFGFSVMIVWFPSLLKGKGSRARKEVSEAMSGYNARLQSFLGGLPVLKSYGYQRRSALFMCQSNREVAARESRQLKCQIAVYGITAFLQLSKDGLLLITSVVLVARDAIDVGSLVTVLQLASLLASPIEVLAYLRHARNEVGPLLKRYENILEETGLKNAENPLPEREAEVDEKLRELRVKDLSFDIDGISILKNISHTFHAGEKYLVTGENGSGKSTLLRLLSRTPDRETTGGAIFYNGKDIDKVPENLYYQHISPIFQEPYLFCMTFRENILLGRDIPEPVYRKVVERLNLDYLLKRYEGREISPEIVEQLSGGEKQRIALARAMVGQPDAYLCDEVTSALDEKNAENVESILLEEDAMVIMVSHKPSVKLLKRYTEHLVMEEGRLTGRR